MGDFSARAVVVPDGSVPSAVIAAGELRAALVRAGGPDLPLLLSDPTFEGPAFVVGGPPPGESDPTAPDACRVARRGDRLYLWGQGPRGPLYAVYAYLQDVLGFRWLTADREVLPRLQRSAPLPDAELEQRPAFAIRDVGYFEAGQSPWNARLRLNGEFSARSLGPEWGGGMRYTHYVHTFYQLVPPERHFAAHPEYFALVDGRRREALAQLCLTNPDIARIAADGVRSWFAADPHARIASVSQNDWLGACECPDCRALALREGSQVGPILHFVNAVAREVARDYPDRLIDTLAYWYTEDPPRHIRPEPNVVVRLCHMSPTCEIHPVHTCPRNAPFAARLEAWSRIAPRLHIWDYHTNFAHFLMPFPNFHALSADLALFRRRGVESMFCQGDLEAGGGGEWSTLRSYYLARLLWDTSLDPEALIGEFLRGVFPHSYGPVRSYFDLIQATARDPEQHLRMFSPVQAGHLPAKVVGAAGSALDEAAARAAGTGGAAEQAQVRRLRLCVEYVRLAMPPAFALEGDTLRPHVPKGACGSEAGFLRPEERPAALEEFFAELRRQGIRSLKEASPLDDFRRRVGVLAAPHATPVWNAGPWRLRLVPDLGGRIWEASFAGQSFLAPATMEDPDYPASRGYEEGCAGEIGRVEPFEAEACADLAPLVLTATLRGMSAWHHYKEIAVRREIAPDGSDGLRLRTWAVNRDDVPHPLAIRPRFCLAGTVGAVEWRDAQGAWMGADVTAGDGRVVLRGAEGWRARVGAITFECLHGPVDRVQVEAYPWGYRIECVGVQQVVPAGGEVRLEQRWRAEAGGGRQRRAGAAPQAWTPHATGGAGEGGAIAAIGGRAGGHRRGFAAAAEPF